MNNNIEQFLADELYDVTCAMTGVYQGLVIRTDPTSLTKLFIDMYMPMCMYEKYNRYFNDWLNGYLRANSKKRDLESKYRIIKNEHVTINVVISTNSKSKVKVHVGK